MAVIFVGLFIRFLSIGGDNLTSAGYNKYIADIIIALIIYFAGFSKLFRDLLYRRKKKTEVSVSANTETVPGTAAAAGTENDAVAAETEAAVSAETETDDLTDKQAPPDTDPNTGKEGDAQ